ncbi:MAG: hypothetical protein JSU64_01740 [candidate division WOR-3 bacterium]|nr:MAG: hypothetical protein JSU64_01740 [candidate division WOR-3 bacterium]
MYPLKYHTAIAAHWHEFVRAQRILSVASELQRARSMLIANDAAEARNAYDRAFELLDLTVSLCNAHGERYELLRFREMMAHLYVNEADNTELLGELFNVLVSQDKDAYNLLHGDET